MIDTYGRKYVQPYIDTIAKVPIKYKITPIMISVMGLLMGLAAAIFNMVSLPILSVIFLWISGLLDAIDGTVARLTKNQSNIGAFIDIVFDRVVEISILLSFVIRNPKFAMLLFIMTTTFLMSITVFLTSGIMIKNVSEKSFHYQTGITERTETFIAFSLMILLNNYTEWIGYTFAILVIITTIQRFIQSINFIRR